MAEILNLRVDGKIGDSSTSRVYRVFGGEKPLVLKIYKDTPHPLPIVKNAVILNALHNFKGFSHRLETFFYEGLGFTVDFMPADSLAILYTEVEGQELSRIKKPYSLDQVSSLLSNVFAQLKFVNGVALPSDFQIPESARQKFLLLANPPLNYHGDISDTSLIISGEAGTLIDWGASLNQSLDILDAHPIYSSPEVWEVIVTDVGISPHLADAYSLGGIISRMLLGNKFYSVLEEEGDRKMKINPEKIKTLLLEMSIPKRVIDMLSNLLSENPQERLIDAASNALENWNNIERILQGK